MLALFLHYFICLTLLLLPGETFAHLPDPPVFAAVQHYPSLCYLPPDSGLCPSMANSDDNPEESSNGTNGNLITRYYFDMTTEQCYPFGTQNCGGNDNRFESQADCQKRCRMGSFKSTGSKND